MVGMAGGRIGRGGARSEEDEERRRRREGKEEVLVFRIHLIL